MQNSYFKRFLVCIFLYYYRGAYFYIFVNKITLKLIKFRGFLVYNIAIKLTFITKWLIIFKKWLIIFKKWLIIFKKWLTFWKKRLTFENNRLII